MLSSEYTILNQHEFFNFRDVGFLGVGGVVVASGNYSLKSLGVFVIELCFEVAVIVSICPSAGVHFVYDGGG